MRKLDKNLPVGYLSPSAIKLYALCPRAYYYRYVDKKEETISSRQVIGKSFHTVLHKNNTEKIKTGSDLPLNDLIDAWRDEWREKGTRIDIWQESISSEETFIQGTLHLQKFRQHYAGKYLPTFAEKRVTGMLGDVPVLGYVDMKGDRLTASKGLFLREEDGETSLHPRFLKVPTIVDYKVSRRAVKETDLTKDVQMIVYSTLLKTPNVEHITFVKTKEPKVQRIKTQIVPDQVNRVSGFVRSVRDAIVQGSFPFCDPQSWKCSPHYCGYWNVCPQGAGK